VLKKAYIDHTNEIKELKAKLTETGETSDSDLQADYDALMNDYNEVVEENEMLKATIAEYEAKENSFTEEEKSAKKKTSNKK
jgi:chromosome segregation ATPase